jgi:hypothetical protein
MALNVSCPALVYENVTVSQICSLTWVLSLTVTFFDANYTPTVTLYCYENSPLMYLMSIEDLPTPKFS